MESNKAVLKAILPRFEQPPDYQAKVEVAKSDYQALSAPELVRAFSMQRHEKHNLEDLIKVHNVHLEALSQLIIETLEAEGIQKLTTDGGETVYINTESYATVTNKGLLMGWIAEQDLAELLSINFRTLNSLVKEMLTQGKEVPAGVSVFLKTSARVRGTLDTLPERPFPSQGLPVGSPTEG
jgi:hypothetical protein